MAMNIKDPEAERLAAEVAALTGESKTAAVRAALRERRERLNVASGPRLRTLRRFLEDEIWPRVPPEIQDGPPMTKAEREELLGYGPEGV
ncbi:type II toxin-antitoxin system VapB family antitoxin [Actinophytocola glycyrrhizae]|uniref:Type II toxin-antitoxin system VapB family antitoxin n=1 Tax=Actinophytocola glycyrrhizae TaxID=2044873 RepID=A0ABV9SD78_9PSEU